MGKWTKFVLIKEGDKTNVWDVATSEGLDRLGEIKWFSRWRKYAFFPYIETVYENDCLKDIVSFIETQMRARKQK